MHKLVCFGEIMMRLSAPNHLRFIQSNKFDINFGGGEYNVAVSVANFGLKTEFVTRIPDNDLGHYVGREIRKNNVGTTHIDIGGQRLGIYFLEQGIGNRVSQVIYDRAHSAMAEIQVGSIDWKSVFEDATWFHWSGITPAISKNAADECLNAIKMAHKMGLRISTDLNYRKKLWNYGAQPFEVMPELLTYSNVILGDIDTALFLLNETQVNPNYSNTEALVPYYNELFSKLKHLKYMATVVRNNINTSQQKISGIIYNGKTILSSSSYETVVLDRVGRGDAFMAALIYALIMRPQEVQYAIDFSTAACCLKHSIMGDYNLITLKEIELLMRGASGLISR